MQGTPRWLEGPACLKACPGGSPAGAGSHHEAKCLEPQMLAPQGVLGRRREVKPVLSADGQRASCSPHPLPLHPVNLYYFLLLAVSSNKLRLITRLPAQTQTCLLFENSLLYYINQ